MVKVQKTPSIIVTLGAPIPQKTHGKLPTSNADLLDLKFHLMSKTTAYYLPQW